MLAIQNHPKLPEYQQLIGTPRSLAAQTLHSSPEGHLTHPGAQHLAREACWRRGSLLATLLTVLQ